MVPLAAWCSLTSWHRILGCLRVVDGKLALGKVEVAREAVGLFETMNSRWWACPAEAYIYNEFADALREGMEPAF